MSISTIEDNDLTISDKRNEIMKGISQLLSEDFKLAAIEEKKKGMLAKNLNAVKTKIFMEDLVKVELEKEVTTYDTQIKLEDYIVKQEGEYILEIPLADLHANEGSMGDMDKWNFEEVIIVMNFVLDFIINYKKNSGYSFSKVIFSGLGDLVDFGIHTELKANLTLKMKQSTDVLAEIFVLMNTILKDKYNIDSEFFMIDGNHGETRENGEKPNVMFENGDKWISQNMETLFMIKGLQTPEKRMVSYNSNFNYAMPYSLGTGKNTRLISHQDRDGGKLKRVMLQVRAEYNLNKKNTDNIFYDVGHYHSKLIELQNDNFVKTQHTCMQPMNLYAKNGFAGVGAGYLPFMFHLSDSTGKRVFTGEYDIKNWDKANIGFVHFSPSDLITGRYIYDTINSGKGIREKDFENPTYRAW